MLQHGGGGGGGGGGATRTPSPVQRMRLGGAAV